MLATLFLLKSGEAYVGFLLCNDMYSGKYLNSKHGSIGHTTSYSINVKRGSASIADGGEYIPGETLSISLSSNPSQYAIEMTGGATFESGGKCQNKRKDNGGGSVTMPSVGSGAVTIKAVAGTGQYSTVNMLPSITLTEQQSPSPTPQPSAAPTPQPSAAPTPQPSAAPTTAPSGPSYAPSAQPTSPTPNPTLRPTPTPTTSQPTSTPTNSTLLTSANDVQVISFGFIAGAIAIILVLPMGVFYYTNRSKTAAKVAVAS